MKKSIFGIVLVLAALIAVVAWLVNNGLRELPGEKLFKYAPETVKGSVYIRPGEIYGSRFVQALTEKSEIADESAMAEMRKIAELCDGVLLSIDEDMDGSILLATSKPLDEVVSGFSAVDKKSVEKVEYNGKPAYRDSDGDYHVELEPGVILLNVREDAVLPEKKSELSAALREKLAAVPPEAAAFFFGRSELPPLPGVANPSTADFKGVLKFGENNELVILADASGLSDQEGGLIATLPTLARTMLLNPNMSGVNQEQLALASDLFDAVQIDYRKGSGTATLEVVIPIELAERIVEAGRKEMDRRRKALVQPEGPAVQNQVNAK